MPSLSCPKNKFNPTHKLNNYQKTMRYKLPIIIHGATRLIEGLYKTSKVDFLWKYLTLISEYASGAILTWFQWKNFGVFKVTSN